MRDAHRMREKYDLSFDSRQVVSLLIGGIVVLGAVFVLGVLVGKKLAGTQRAEQAPDLLAALDHKSDVLERARAAPQLTFQEELTRVTPKLVPPAKVAPVAAAPAPAKPAAIATPTPSSSAPAGAAPILAATKPSPAAPTAAPAALVAAFDAMSSTAEPVTTRTTPAAAKSSPKPPEAAAANGAFTLQLGASPNRDDAERQASRLREKGYAPYIVSAEVSGKGTWYRVRMGSFPTKDAATRYLQDFKRETQTEAFVASTK
jgi:DedD protein